MRIQINILCKQNRLCFSSLTRFTILTAIHYSMAIRFYLQMASSVKYYGNYLFTLCHGWATAHIESCRVVRMMEPCSNGPPMEVKMVDGDGTPWSHSINRTVEMSVCRCCVVDCAPLCRMNAIGVLMLCAVEASVCYSVISKKKEATIKTTSFHIHTSYQYSWKSMCICSLLVLKSNIEPTELREHTPACNLWCESRLPFVFQSNCGVQNRSGIVGYSRASSRSAHEPTGAIVCAYAYKWSALNWSSVSLQNCTMLLLQQRCTRASRTMMYTTFCWHTNRHDAIKSAMLLVPSHEKMICRFCKFCVCISSNVILQFDWHYSMRQMAKRQIACKQRDLMWSDIRMSFGRNLLVCGDFLSNSQYLKKEKNSFSTSFHDFDEAH